jgi:hypothetical protein
MGVAVTVCLFRDITALGVAVEVLPRCTARAVGQLLALHLWPRLACQAALVAAEVLPVTAAIIIAGVFAMNILIGHTALLGVAVEVLPGCTTKVVLGRLARDPWLRLGGC